LLNIGLLMVLRCPSDGISDTQGLVSDEAATFQRAAGSISAATTRGGLQIEAPDGLRFFASESLTVQSWRRRVARSQLRGTIKN
jgi:hypothetical protein